MVHPDNIITEILTICLISSVSDIAKEKLSNDHAWVCRTDIRIVSFQRTEKQIRVGLRSSCCLEN